jgi:glycosyltransferase involved in cell wall biosynthesis
MTTYNEEVPWLEESINSILNQSYKDLEIIIVVDNKENLQVIERLKIFENQNSFIKVIINEKNIGLALSLNKAFELSSGQYIARMDADDISSVNRFDKQMKIFEANHEVDLVTSNCRYINEYGEKFGEQQLVSMNDKQIKKSLEIMNFLIHPSWLMKRNTFIQLNGYRNFECSQDYDFLLRMVTNNLKIYLLNEYLVDYRVRDNSISISKGFKQFIIADYIQKMYQERQKKEQKLDSFSEENLNEFISRNYDNDSRQKFNLAKIAFDKARSENKLHFKIYYILKCLLISRYSRKLIVDALRFQLIRKVGY